MAPPRVAHKPRKVTRYHIRMRRTQFRFLELPGELRNSIYEISFHDVHAVETYFERYYKRLQESQHPDSRGPIAVRQTTPVILLLNQEIFREAIGVLRNQLLESTLNFNHGLFNLAHLEQIVCPNILQNLGSITISDSVHSDIEDKIFEQSLGGLLRLFGTLSSILSKGHKLKELKIRLMEPKLNTHVLRCWNQPHRCYVSIPKFSSSEIFVLI